MATLLKVLNNLADIKSAGGVALGLGTQAWPRMAASEEWKIGRARSGAHDRLDNFPARVGLDLAMRADKPRLGKFCL
jgi:hypothetical protein